MLAGQKIHIPNWLPPISIELCLSFILVLIGSNIEHFPQEYYKYLTNPLVFIIGILISAGLAALKKIPLSFAMAFFLVNIIRIMPKNKRKKKNSPGTKESFSPSGAIEWVNTNKKWFVEKVLHEKPVGIIEKEVYTYPVN